MRAALRVFYVASVFSCVLGMENNCDSGGCVDEEDDDHALLQLDLKKHGSLSHKEEAREDPEPQQTPEEDQGGSDELKPDLVGEFMKKKIPALVPKNLKPLSLEELRKQNASLQEVTPEVALMEKNEREEYSPVYDDGVYCGSSTRFDVADFMGAALSLEACYVFSCVDPFKVSSTCGPYFYTNGQGNCKCCDHGSKLYYSSANPPNYLYSCR
jgi:hypothetical protein